jgi:tetratricopeptide (TPR) repeat protein
VGRFSEAYESFKWLMDRANDKDKSIQKDAKMASDRVSSYFAAHFNEGVNDLKANNLESARDEFLKATQINPEKPDGFLNLGYTQNQLGDVDGAITSFRKAIEIAPDRKDAYEYYAVALAAKRDALMKSDKPDSSQVAQVAADLKSTLEKVIQVDQANDTALSQLGELELAAGEDSMAISHYTKAIEIQPDNLAKLYNVAVGFYQRDQFKQAAKSFAIVTDHADTTTDHDLWRDAMYNRALSLKSDGQNEQALSCAQKLIASDDKDPKFHQLASGIYVALKDTKKAQEEWDRAEALDKEATSSSDAGK